MENLNEKFEPEKVAEALKFFAKHLHKSNEEKIAKMLEENFSSLEIIMHEYEKSEQPNEDISWLKRQIKYSKNPMERKTLEKRLNEAYKELKKNERVL